MFIRERGCESSTGVRHPERGVGLLRGPVTSGKVAGDLLEKSGKLLGNLYALNIYNQSSSWEVTGEHLGKFREILEVQGVSRRSGEV